MKKLMVVLSAVFLSVSLAHADAASGTATGKREHKPLHHKGKVGKRMKSGSLSAPATNAAPKQ